jgi:hypothetical protein
LAEYRIKEKLNRDPKKNALGKVVSIIRAC